jgi:hypothetical protein
MEMWTALFTVLGTAIGTFGGIVTSNKLTQYRIQQLEKKVERHNDVVNRTFVLEREVKSVWHNIDEIKDGVERIKEREMES